MILRPVSPVSPCGPPITKRPVGLMWYFVLGIHHVRRNHRIDDVLANRGAKFFGRHRVVVLRGDDHGIDANRFRSRRIRR